MLLQVHFLSWKEKNHHHHNKIIPKMALCYKRHFLYWVNSASNKNLLKNELRWQSHEVLQSSKEHERSSVSERNCFSAPFDGFCFQVRKLETGVPEGTHILAPHWKTRVFNFQTWKGLLLNERRNENPALFLWTIWRELRKSLTSCLTYSLSNWQQVVLHNRKERHSFKWEQSKGELH